MEGIRFYAYLLRGNKLFFFLKAFSRFKKDGETQRNITTIYAYNVLQKSST